MNTGQIDNAFGELREILGDRATTSPVHRMAYSRDWSPRYREMNDLPDIVVIPNDTQEMVQIARVAHRYEIPLIPFAGGTGMGGGAVAWKGGIMVETKGLNRILEIDGENMTTTVQSGITIEVLNSELARHKLWLPHQPESKKACTIGASIGCDNNSTFGIRYGKIRDCLLNVVIVTGGAEAVRVGQRKVSFSSTVALLYLFIPEKMWEIVCSGRFVARVPANNNQGAPKCVILKIKSEYGYTESSGGGFHGDSGCGDHWGGGDGFKHRLQPPERWI